MPRKHGRGGQSARRFSRLAAEARHNYVRKVCELASEVFLPELPQAIVVAGSADLKTVVVESPLLDPRVSSRITRVLDVAYGGEAGLNEALDQCADLLGSVRFVAEKRLLERFFETVATTQELCAFGVAETLEALRAGAVEQVIVFKDLPDYLDAIPGPLGAEFRAKAPDSSVRERVVSWLVNHHADFGATLELVSDATQEGAQFCKGLGGCCAVLRYPVYRDEDDPDNNSDNDSDNDTQELDASAF